jgi:predicted TIM-barrel enzyme
MSYCILEFLVKVVKRVPVLAGVCASDPFRRMDRFLLELERLGFDGIQNFPTVGLIDGNFRQNLEETGMGYGYKLLCSLLVFLL